MIVRLLTIAILVIVIGYGIREALPLLAGPSISVTEPRNGESFHNGFITILGSTLHTQSVSLDGSPLVTDEKGNFKTTLTLPRGGAILSLTATDRFGRSITERRTVFVP